MQGIIFIYEKKRSTKNRLFTIRIEERKKRGDIWVPAGPKGFYTARDLQRPGLHFIEPSCFSMAFKSETDLRSMEGRFFSPDQEYSLFRIAPHDLKSFLGRSMRKGVLCGKDGCLIRFNYMDHIVPQIRFNPLKQGVAVTVSLAGRPVGKPCYATVSNPVRIVCNSNVYELVRDLPVTVVKNLITGRVIPDREYEAVLKDLSAYAEKLDLMLPGGKKVLRPNAVTPILDIDTSFKFARLKFMYEKSGPFAMGDKRKIIFDPENNTELHRNFKKETIIVNELEKCGARYRATTKGDWFIPEKSREKILYRLGKSRFLITLSGKPLALDIDVKWEIRVKEKKLSVQGQVCCQSGSSGLENIMDACLGGQRWFELPKGFYGYIPEKLFEDFRRLELRGDFKDQDIRFEPYDFSFVAEVFRGKNNVVQDQSFKAYLSFLKNISGQKGKIETPKALKTQLRSYQKTGFKWLTGLQQFRFGGILADDMGLGKTVQVLALLLYLKEKNNSCHLTLLVVPKTLIYNWESEIKKFAPSLETKIHAGPDRDKSFDDLAGLDLIITSYGIVRQDQDMMEPISWDLIVLDEAQAVKNPDAKISRFIRALQSANRLMLTGTPIENRPLDLWSLFDFLMPGFLGTRTAFREKYEQNNPDALETLGILTAPFILRRMKKQVCHELPAKTEITLFCPFSKEQKIFYDELFQTGRLQLSDPQALEPPGKSQSMQILTWLLRLRQAACHPALIPEAGAFKGSSGKFEAILETAGDILQGGYKILIFSQFVAHLELVKEMLAGHGIECHVLYGSTRERKQVIDRFKRSKNPCVFLISLKTGGVGLNLTQAGYVFLLDPWWNPAIENQAIDRSHRIGQENPVTVYRFITQDSVEAGVNRLKEKKKRIEKAVLQHDAFENPPFTEKELLELIR